MFEGLNRSLEATVFMFTTLSNDNMYWMVILGSWYQQPTVYILMEDSVLVFVPEYYIVLAFSNVLKQMKRYPDLGDGDKMKGEVLPSEDCGAGGTADFPSTSLLTVLSLAPLVVMPLVSLGKKCWIKASARWLNISS